MATRNPAITTWDTKKTPCRYIVGCQLQISTGERRISEPSTASTNNNRKHQGFSLLFIQGKRFFQTAFFLFLTLTFGHTKRKVLICTLNAPSVSTSILWSMGHFLPASDCDGDEWSLESCSRYHTKRGTYATLFEARECPVRITEDRNQFFRSLSCVPCLASQ